MNKNDILEAFYRMRKIHTIGTVVVVLLLVATILYTYISGPLLDYRIEKDFILILISAVVNLVIVIYSTGMISRELYHYKEGEDLEHKIRAFRKAYLKQLYLMGIFTIINGIAFLLTDNNVFFIEAFVMLLFLYSLNPSMEKFLTKAPLTVDEKEIFHRHNV